MSPYRRASADKSTIYERNKSRYSHDKHASNNMAPDASHAPRRRRSYRRAAEPDTSSSDEILIKGRASRRARRDADKDVSRQLRVISKAQREILRSSSSSKDKVHIHLVPIVSKSPSPEPKSRSSSEASSEAKSTRSSVSGLATQLMDITKSWIHRHSDDSTKSSPRSPRSPHSRPKHQKRAKHGKKRVSTSQYLAPLAERWVCYGCGKLRSHKMQARYPLQEGQKMAPNYCGKCRVHGELQGRAISFEGKRNYCWGCGIIRSQTYNNENPVDEGGMCTPNYCKPCREASPKFDPKLRESSEIGSAVDLRDKAFARQVHDAELSDVEDDTDSEPTSAPGKENVDPKPKAKKQLKASKSFMLENFSYKVKTTSSVSSGDSAIPISILKALRLDEEPVRSGNTSYSTNTTNSVGDNVRRPRLSSQTYQPPIVESEVSVSSRISTKAVDSESSSSYYETNSPKKSRQTEEPSSPVTVRPYKDDSSDNSSTQKKKVHWYKKAPQPSTTADTVASAGDSAYYSNRFSTNSNLSTGSRRMRRSPADYSTGSPPTHLGEATSGDLRETARLQEQNAARWSQASGRGFGQELPTEGTFGQPRYSTDAPMPSYRHVSENSRRHVSENSQRQDSTESPRSTPATSPEAHVRARATFAEHAANAGYERPFSPLIDSEAPRYSRSYQGPSQGHVSPDFSPPFLSAKGQRSRDFRQPDQAYHQGNSARKGHSQEYPAYQSAAHFGDSTTSHDEEDAMRNGQYDQYGSAPDEDYSHGWGGATYVHEDARSSSSDSPGYTAANSTGYGAFDFSGFGASRPEPFASAASAAPKVERFQRKSKKSNGNNSTPPKAQEWHLYDDGESAPNTKDVRWKKDGRTTVHRSGEREKTVRILHIREVASDDETSLSEADNDEASEIDTVIAGSRPMKSICAA